MPNTEALSIQIDLIGIRMLTKEQIVQALRAAEELNEGSDYNISKASRSTVCTQRALDILVKKFDEESLKKVEGPEVFTVVPGQAFYPSDEPESITIPGA